MTGTPLDLTPFGPFLKAAGLLYWLPALALIALALWLIDRWWLKLAVAAAITAGFAVPALHHKEATEKTQQVAHDAAKAKLAAAMVHFEMRCKGVGEKVTRTVDKVEGVVWMKWRDKAEPSDDADQFKLFDPYGRDCTGVECISNLLRVTAEADKNPEVAARHRVGYRFVETTEPKTGQRVRYSAAIKVTQVRTADQIAQYKKNQGVDPGPDVYGFSLNEQSIEGYTVRYGVTWDDISTREDREHWVAGGSIKVIDLKTTEVIAERVGFLIDTGQGNTGGFRSPWGWARTYSKACPPLTSDKNTTFVFKVLQPAKYAE